MAREGFVDKHVRMTAELPSGVCVRCRHVAVEPCNAAGGA